MTFRQFASVVLDVTIQKPLEYAVPDELIGKISSGALVKVPLNGSTRHGVVISVRDIAEFPKTKPIAGLIKGSPPLSEELLQLILWMADYYCTPLEQVLKMVVPSSVRGKAREKEQRYVSRAKSLEELKNECQLLRLKSPKQAEMLEVLLSVKKGIFLTELLERTDGSHSTVQVLSKKGFLHLDKVHVDRSPLIDEEYFPSKPKILTPEQAVALEKVQASLRKQIFETHVLWGITGSGKTEVYLQAIAEALKAGKSALMLVPEIALTPQTIERFKSRFEGLIAVLHCRLSHGERYDEWMKIANGTAKIVIGARSAIFSPVENLGLIVVDEEHDSSYKQSESMPCYHARDVAVMRAKLAKAAIILGSATPSLETFFNCTSGKYILSTLKNRASDAALPTVKIVDMRKEFEKKKGFTIFSEALLNAIEKRIKTGEQSILFLNRRGYHTILLCKGCGASVQCEHCELALTHHLGENRLACHLCGFERSPPTTCPHCKNESPLKFKGIGTEQVEKALYAIFPGIRILRMDRDTTKHKGSHQKLLRDFKTGKADLLIGTQMIAKGLHIPEVTLVGVLSCDSSLNIPDFRASENSFQLLTQVAGRSGRGAVAGEVILQTAIPENNTVQLAAKQDFEHFFEMEIASRKIFDYPPFSQLAKIRASGKEREKTLQQLHDFRALLIPLLPKDFTLSPVTPAGYPKVKDEYRFQFLVRGAKMSFFSRLLNENFGKKIVQKFFHRHQSSFHLFLKCIR